MEYIKPLKESRSNEIGTKAKNLKIVALKTNYKIPETLVLTSSLHKKIMSENKIDDPLKYNWLKLKFPSNFEEELREKIKITFGTKPLVIRSSASCEDSPILSFAGQYSSFLNIKGQKKVLRAVRLCYASLFSKNAIVYSKLKHKDFKKIFMSVMIQEVEQIFSSGVMFTANPVTGNKEEVIIEYGDGLGDKIVDGSVVPRLERISKDKIGITKKKFLRNLTEAGIKIEKVFKGPRDIEWGYGKSGIVLLQIRPITNFRNLITRAKIPRNIKEIGKGVPVSYGTDIGKLKIIKSIKDYSKIKNGDIALVSNSPDIRIIEKIDKLKGIIITGGILSHFAVIAREFSKPCISQVDNFDHKKYENQEIYLDAINGLVYITR